MQTNVLIEQPVKLAGDVEDRDLQLLQKAVMEALQAAGVGTDAVIDLSDVATLSSNALDLLRQASAMLRRDGRRLAIVCRRRPVARVIDFEAVCGCMDGAAHRGCAPRTTRSAAQHHARGTERNPADAEAGSEAWYFEESLLF